LCVGKQRQAPAAGKKEEDTSDKSSDEEDGRSSDRINAVATTLNKFVVSR
jgi:hypothetical protein